MAKLVLGLVGEMGSGKGSVAKYLVENHGAGTHKLSQIFRDILDRIYIEQTRENISELSLILRKAFGEDVLAKSIFHDVQNDPHEIVVLDGVRRMEDMVFLKTLPEFKLVYIEASLEVCYERIVKRGENNGDSTKTFDEFKLDHEADADARIVGMKNSADIVIENNGSYEELHEKIDEIINQNLNK